MFLGSMTDRSGRVRFLVKLAIFPHLCSLFVCPFTFSLFRRQRPVYILCMILYAAANAGLANTNSYATLMGLRCLQAAGSASVISIGEHTWRKDHTRHVDTKDLFAFAGAGSIADLYPGATRALPMGIFQVRDCDPPSLTSIC